MLLSKAKKTVVEQVKDVKGRLEKTPEPPLIILDPSTKQTYSRGKLLGKGAFARVYELTDKETGDVYAGKIIAKSRISKPNQREKLDREIEVHQQLSHENIVGFITFFQDEDFIYIILDYCANKSLGFILKQRKTFTEPEARYFFQQTLSGVEYMHSVSVIHRDIKVGNLFVDEDMNVKIGDFGLAAILSYEGEKKRTICGTPNYIAPEVLNKLGHSFEADVWALGCVLYTMLVGKPPFETSSLKETYLRIKSIDYSLPNHLSDTARDLIKRLLHKDPCKRLSLDNTKLHDFLKKGYIPDSLPGSVCQTAPEFREEQTVQEVQNETMVEKAAGKNQSGISILSRSSSLSITSDSITSRSSNSNSSRSVNKAGKLNESVQKLSSTLASQLRFTAEKVNRFAPSIGSPKMATKFQGPKTISIRSMTNTLSNRSMLCTPSSLYSMLCTCLDHMPQDEYRKTPLYKAKHINYSWVTKWVDYSNKCGFGYQLSDQTVGVLFTDCSRTCLAPDKKTVQYHANDKVTVFPMTNIPRNIRRKVILLDYFATYMNERLMSAGECEASGKPIDYTNEVINYIQFWYRTGRAMVMYLSDGTLQVNFFDDHTKLIVANNNNDHVVTYIKADRTVQAHRLISMAHHGCSDSIRERMDYARDALKNVVDALE